MTLVREPGADYAVSAISTCKAKPNGNFKGVGHASSNLSADRNRMHRALGFSDFALADAIDGDWCRTDGKRMTIRGSAIVTPGGQHTSGDYARHSFSYVIPAGGAGTTVSIQLLGEYLAHARQIIEEWRIDYDTNRPHSSLNGLTPTEFAARPTKGHNRNRLSL